MNNKRNLSIFILAIAITFISSYASAEESKLNETCGSITNTIDELSIQYEKREKAAYDVHIAAASTRDCKGLNDAHRLYYEMWEGFSEFEKLRDSFYSLSCSDEQKTLFRSHLNRAIDLQFSSEISIHLIVDQKKEFSCKYI